MMTLFSSRSRQMGRIEEDSVHQGSVEMLLCYFHNFRAELVSVDTNGLKERHDTTLAYFSFPFASDHGWWCLVSARLLISSFPFIMTGWLVHKSHHLSRKQRACICKYVLLLVIVMRFLPLFFPSFFLFPFPLLLCV